MNVASLELCKELYELSAWEGESHSSHGYEDDDGNRIPYYTLGYLLRKLPDRWWIKYRGGDYVAKWDNHQLEVFADADTPEDAVCKLAIKMFEKEILIKDSAGLGV